MTNPPPLPRPSPQDQRLWYALKTPTELLDERSHELTTMEYNGLLSTALRLRNAFFNHSAYFLTLEQNLDAMDEIDSVLNRFSLKPPAKGGHDEH